MRRLIFLLVAVMALAHELNDNRATLVLRDKTHVSVTLYLNYPEALHQALAPQRPMAEFLAVHAALTLEQLKVPLERAQAKFMAGTRMTGADGEVIPLSGWTWPSVRDVQLQMQHQMMRAIVDPGNHTHEDPLEVKAEGVAAREIGGVKVQFPEEFDKVLVVAYKPSQTEVGKSAVSPVIRF